MAAMYGFSDQCTAVGTSYFVRLAARDERCGALSPSLTPPAFPDWHELHRQPCGGSTSQGLCLPTRGFWRVSYVSYDHMTFIKLLHITCIAGFQRSTMSRASF